MPVIILRKILLDLKENPHHLNSFFLDFPIGIQCRLVKYIS